MIFTVLTLFPGIFDSPLRESITKKAVEKGLISFNIANIREYADDAHKTCDDAPYGGGPGMVMKIEPIYRAMAHLEKTMGRPRYILLSPQGRIFDEETAIRYSHIKHLCLVPFCKHSVIYFRNISFDYNGRCYNRFI